MTKYKQKKLKENRSNIYRKYSLAFLVCILMLVFTYAATVSVTINSPSTSGVLRIPQNTTFIINATFSCTGAGTCGNLSNFAVYNITGFNTWWNESYRYRQQINFTEPLNYSRTWESVKLNFTIAANRLKNENGTVLVCNKIKMPWDGYSINTTGGWVRKLEGIGQINMTSGQKKTCYLYYDPITTVTEIALPRTGWNQLYANVADTPNIARNLTPADVSCNQYSSDGQFNNAPQCGLSTYFKEEQWCYWKAPQTYTNNLYFKVGSDDGSQLFFENMLTIADNNQAQGITYRDNVCVGCSGALNATINKYYNLKITFAQGMGQYELDNRYDVNAGDNANGNVMSTTCYPFYGDQWLLKQSKGAEENYYNYITIINKTSGTKPLWTTSNQPQNCILNTGNSCTKTWKINATGTVGTIYGVTAYARSNMSPLNFFEKLGIFLKIKVTKGNEVGWGKDSISMIGNRSATITKIVNITSYLGNNTNVAVSCKSGTCAKFTNNWTTQTMQKDQTKNVKFTCDSSVIGNYSAIYKVNSTEFPGGDLLNVSCSVLRIYGKIGLKLLLPPMNNLTLIGQGKIFIMKVNISCIGGIGAECGNVTSFSRDYNLTKRPWWNTSYSYRQKLLVNTTVNTGTNYQILVALNSTNTGSKFNWTNGCQGIRFIDSGTADEHYIDTCNITAKKAFIWVKVPSAITTTGKMIEMYYGLKYNTYTINPANVFTINSIYRFGHFCSSADGNCYNPPSHATLDTSRANIGIAPYNFTGSDLVTQVYDTTNPYSAQQDYFGLRWRWLFIPNATKTLDIGVDSDDGSDVSLFPEDGYGGGIRTTHPFGAHTVLASWYGGHGTGTCGLSGTIGTKTFTGGKAYWMEYMFADGNGGQQGLLCFKQSGAPAYNTWSTTNLPGQLYSRSYITPEPTVTVLPLESLDIPTTAGSYPFWTTSGQPRKCTNMLLGQSCLVNWTMSVQGNVSDQYTIDVLSQSTYTQVLQNTSQKAYVRITRMYNDSSASIQKFIDKINTNMYLIKLTIKNKLNLSKKINVYDFVNGNFTAGSFNILPKNTSTITGVYSGKLYMWNLTINPLSSKQVNYSISGTNTTSYHLLKNEIFGLD